MNRVMSQEEARSKRPHLFGETFVRDYPFALDGSEARSTLLDDEADVLETLTGYVLRWGIPVEATRVDSNGRAYTERNAYDREALDEWLTEHDPAEVKVCYNHHGELIGRWLDFTADDYGLRGQAEIFDTPAGLAALAEALRSGEPSLSCRTRFSIDDASVEQDEDGEYRRVHRMSLEEAGPVDEPADPGARIQWLGNRWVGGDAERDVLELLPVEDLARDIMSFVGPEFAEKLDEVRFASARQREADEDQAGRLIRCVTAIREARQAAGRAWAYYRDGISKIDEYRAAEAQVDEHELWLRQQVSYADFRELTAGLPRRIDLQERLLTDVRHRALPVGRW